MKVITSKVDLAIILWDAMYEPEVYMQLLGEPKPKWDELEQFNKDIWLDMAENLLGKVKVAIK